MSTLAAVRAVAPIVEQPGTMHVLPADQSRQASSSAAHRVIADRANSAGAFTVPKNRKAPKEIQSVKATESSTPLMFPRRGADQQQ